MSFSWNKTWWNYKFSWNSLTAIKEQLLLKMYRIGTFQKYSIHGTFFLHARALKPNCISAWFQGCALSFSLLSKLHWSVRSQWYHLQEASCVQQWDHGQNECCDPNGISEYKWNTPGMCGLHSAGDHRAKGSSWCFSTLNWKSHNGGGNDAGNDAGNTSVYSGNHMGMGHVMGRQTTHFCD